MINLNIKSKTSKEKDIIFKDLENKYNRTKEELPDYDIVGIFLQGSQNYNLSIYNDNYKSDIDTICLVIPKLKTLINKTIMQKKTIIMEDNSHILVKPVDEFIKLLYRGNVQFIEILYTPFYLIKTIECSDYIEDIRRIFSKYEKTLLRNKIYKAMLGMMKQKKIALTKEYAGTKEKIEKFGGYDPKQLHHMIRLYATMYRMNNENIGYGEAMVLSSPVIENLIKVKEKGAKNLKNAILYSDAILEAVNKINFENTEKYKDDFLEVMTSKYNDFIYKQLKKEIETTQ